MDLDEIITLVSMKELEENQYLDVFVCEGEIIHTIPRERWMGYLTMGISNYFTKPYVDVTGYDNNQNREVIDRLRQEMVLRGIPYTLHNSLYES